MSTTLTQDRILEFKSWDPRKWTRVNDAGIDLVLMHRTGMPTLTAQDLEAACVDSIRSTVEKHCVEECVNEALAGLRLSAFSDLVTDMSQLAVHFLEQFRLDHANLRIELVDRQSCPKFHCDAKQVRLITTYAGLTTEYRHASDGAKDRAVPLGSVALLKGTTHPTHCGEHVLHRSPEMIPPQRRLCMVMDY